MKKQKESKKFMFRLYRQFDIDLIYIYETLRSEYESDFVQEYLKSLIRHGLNGSELTRKEESIRRALFQPQTNQTVLLRYRIAMQIKLDVDKDADIINAIDGLQIGYKNTAIKSAIRCALRTPCLFPCLESTELNVEKFAKE